MIQICVVHVKQILPVYNWFVNWFQSIGIDIGALLIMRMLRILIALGDAFPNMVIFYHLRFHN